MQEPSNRESTLALCESTEKNKEASTGKDYEINVGKMKLIQANGQKISSILEQSFEFSVLSHNRFGSKMLQKNKFHFRHIFMRRE